MLEIHLLDCGTLGHRHHVEGGQQAERTDEDSRACCWLSVGYPGGGGGGCRQHQKQLQPQSDADPWNDAGGCSFHQTLQCPWAGLKPLLPGHFISCLPAAAGHSDVSAQNCTVLCRLNILSITLYSGVFFLRCPHNKRFLQLSVHTELTVSLAATSCIGTPHRCPFVF